MRRTLRTVGTYAGIVLLTLALLDVALIALDLFPLRTSPGDPVLGWRPAPATGRMETGRCEEFSTGTSVRYQRNEDGIRTSVSRAEKANGAAQVRLAVVGDSHTDLCAPNEELHSGVLARRLSASGVPSVSLTYGVGRYSPLQAYLAFRAVLQPYEPRVLILNLYTGNDFNDIFRIDDRPHLEATDSGYRIAPPTWFTLDEPGSRRHSRVLGVLRSLGDRTGLRANLHRLAYLHALGGGSLAAELSYLRSLLAAKDPSVGYPDALTAQMLNQQLFFHFFPDRLDEALRRVRFVLATARRENPGLILVLSPIPSYELVGEEPVDSALVRVTRRLPISLDEGRRQEQHLYDALRPLAEHEGWLFVDNLAALRQHRSGARLYNDFDYHLTPVASEVIGRAQSDVLLPVLRTIVAK